jgi:hypothetical protein
VYGGWAAMCALTAGGRPRCWGMYTNFSPVLEFSNWDNYGPWPLELEGVRAMHLGERHFAFRADGSALAWNLVDDSVALADVVEANSAKGLECIVRSSGEVVCTIDGKQELVVERLRGARQLALAPKVGMVVGLRPDGTILGDSLRGQTTPTFANAEDLIVLLPRDHAGNILGIRRDGRVFEWTPEQKKTNAHYVVREIALPDPSVVAPVAAAPHPPASNKASSDEDDSDTNVIIDETKLAAERCNAGWAKFQAGELARAKVDVDAALTVLERAQDERGKRSLGACLYNRGRIAEQEGELDAARELYERSLAARSNDTVRARLDSLRTP